MPDLRYPIGSFDLEKTYTADDVARAIERIDAAPRDLRAALEGLSKEQLDTHYRPDGWTVRQVTHHLPDSHMNSYVRMKLTVTEDEPTIRPYDEASWGTLADAEHGDVELSLGLLDTLHRRWVVFLRSLGAGELARRFRHPEFDQPLELGTSIAMYGWHGDHHVAHITALREREGWG